MEHQSIFDAITLGILEGLTEFIPVSSTGHLLLAGHFLGFKSAGKTFEILIQLGAILAIVSVYFGKLWQMLVTLPRSRETQKFVAGILLAFIPAAIIGVLLHDFIETVLFETPKLICVMLVIGGIILLWVDRMDLKPTHHDVEKFPYWLYLGIGFFQCLSLIPGTSRSGATIVGAMLMGVDKRAAAEFSFFLAIPTMVGAFVYDFYKNRAGLHSSDLVLIAIGFVAAFLVALVVVRTLLDFVSKRGYSFFGWWRLVVGIVGFAALFIWG
jgi:undecaprenyl-diphosphatase